MSGNHRRTIKVLSWGIILCAGIVCGGFSAVGQSRKAKAHSTGVYLYQHANYQGKRIFVPQNTMIKNLKAGPWFFNDEASSILLKGIGSVAVFSNAGFQGKCQTVRGSIPNLKSTAVGNDSISSLRVPGDCMAERAVRDPGPAVVLYEHADFKGRSVRLTSNTPDLASHGLGNRISSIQLRGLPVTAVYDETNYMGKCMAITRNISNLKDSFIGNDRISSLKLNCRCVRQYKVTFRNKAAIFLQVYAKKYGSVNRLERRLTVGRSVTWYFPERTRVEIDMYDAKLQVDRWWYEPILEDYRLDMTRNWEIEVSGVPGITELKYQIN